MARAIHGLQRQHPAVLARIAVMVDLVHLCDEHMLAEFLPVTGFFPQDTVHQLRRLYFDIVGRFQPGAHIAFTSAIYCPALRMPEYRAACFFLQMEQVQFPAQFAVIALFRFLNPRQMGF